MADPTGLPNAELPDSVIAELRRAQVPRENFSAVLSAFGQIPADAQCDLAVRLVKAAGNFHFRKGVEQQKFPRAYERRNQVEDISTSAKHLLALLGINDAKSVARGIYPRVKIRINKATTPPTVTTGPAELPQVTINPTATLLLTWLYRVAVERRPAKATVSAHKRLTTLILLLSDLVEAAERCACEIGTQYRKGQGGPRRAGQITAEVELMQAIIGSYAELRKRFPNSGPQPAPDKRLREFVRSGLKFVDFPKPSRITDDAIRGAFARWRAQTKAKTAVDLNISQN